MDMMEMVDMEASTAIIRDCKTELQMEHSDWLKHFVDSTPRFAILIGFLSFVVYGAVLRGDT